MNEHIIALAQKVWDYHHMGHDLQKCDCIMALGSHDLRVAERAADLYLQGFAPLLIFTGGLGRLTEGNFPKPEADLFAEVAIAKDVPAEAILIENKSTNTGENFSFTQKLLEAKGLHPQSFLLVQKPYMERRCWATFRKQWPDKTGVVTSPQIHLLDYVNNDISLEQVINIMVGDLQRIRLYGEKGFQIPQHIPEDVWKAYEELVALGFNKQLAPEK